MLVDKKDFNEPGINSKVFSNTYLNDDTVYITPKEVQRDITPCILDYSTIPFKTDRIYQETLQQTKPQTEPTKKFERRVTLSRPAEIVKDLTISIVILLMFSSMFLPFVLAQEKR